MYELVKDLIDCKNYFFYFQMLHVLVLLSQGFNTIAGVFFKGSVNLYMVFKLILLVILIKHIYLNLNLLVLNIHC